MPCVPNELLGAAVRGGTIGRVPTPMGARWGLQTGLWQGALGLVPLQHPGGSPMEPLPLIIPLFCLRTHGPSFWCHFVPSIFIIPSGSASPWISPLSYFSVTQVLQVANRLPSKEAFHLSKPWCLHRRDRGIVIVQILNEKYAGLNKSGSSRAE